MIRPLLFGAVLAFMVLGGTASAFAQTRIATWNIANLHDRLGEPLRRGAPVRNKADIARLKAVEASLGAHVYALQEINGPTAARLIFPDQAFELCVSSRYNDDRVRGYRKRGANGQRRTDRIYTVLAIRRGHFDAVRCRSVDALGVEHKEADAPARETRRGIAADLTRGGKTITLLSVHMKSRCHNYSLGRAVDGRNERPDCATFERMAIALEQWLDDETRQGRAVVLAGDFNRRINRHFGGAPNTRRDHFFIGLSDGEPAGARLKAVPLKTGTKPKGRSCFAHQRGRSGLYYEEPIDFIMANEAAADLMLTDTATEHDYRRVLGAQFDDRRYKGRHGSRLSDHCPLTVDFNF